MPLFERGSVAQRGGRSRGTERDGGHGPPDPRDPHGSIRRGGATVTKPAFWRTASPPDPVTVRRTSYTPGRTYAWIGFASSLVPPSPNSQRHAIGLGTFDRSENATDSGAGPAAEAESKSTVPTYRMRKMLAPRSMGEAAAKFL